MLPAEGLCHALTGHVVASDLYLSGEWGKSVCWLEDLGSPARSSELQMAHVVIQDLPAGVQTVHVDV